MTSQADFQHLAFFTRLLDAAPAAERYRLAAEQIAHAEQLGFDAAWVAQHHFHEHEGGLPSPFVFLGHLAARTSRIRLGTGIVTLPLELPVRVAEDAIVLDLLSAGRLELGAAMAAIQPRSPGSDSTMLTAMSFSSAIWHGCAVPWPASQYPAATRCIRPNRRSLIGFGRRPFRPPAARGLASPAMG
jgi:hypothetical protein